MPVENVHHEMNTILFEWGKGCITFCLNGHIPLIQNLRIETEINFKESMHHSALCIIFFFL